MEGWLPEEEAAAAARPVWRAVAVGLVLGTLLAVPAILAGLASAGAGHGDYVVARVLFPVPLLFALIGQGTDVFALVVAAAAIAQFPFYGGVLGWTAVRRRYLPVFAVVAAHLCVAAILFSVFASDFS